MTEKKTSWASAACLIAFYVCAAACIAYIMTADTTVNHYHYYLKPGQMPEHLGR